mmetsp:Transcript_88265/g.249206  ORF Transcript_88265/g.249206 Transcript_88265/m.249206 type:complete len:203 (+) Transcript_88265:351-959(+)
MAQHDSDICAFHILVGEIVLPEGQVVREVAGYDCKFWLGLGRGAQLWRCRVARRKGQHRILCGLARAHLLQGGESAVLTRAFVFRRQGFQCAREAVCRRTSRRHGDRDGGGVEAFLEGCEEREGLVRRRLRCGVAEHLDHHRHANDVPLQGLLPEGKDECGFAQLRLQLRLASCGSPQLRRHWGFLALRDLPQIEGCVAATS